MNINDNLKQETSEMVSAIIRLLFKMYAIKGISKEDLCADLGNKNYLLYDLLSHVYIQCDAIVNGKSFDEEDKSNIITLFRDMLEKDIDCDCGKI